ncbi:hypothetical protein D8T48_04055 [Vibrio vulnificus]|nr:hypothetical protein D8T48_04055 [Vibrio vulnificus]
MPWHQAFLINRTSNLEPRTSNLEPRTSNLEPRTSNLEPRTSNLSKLSCVGQKLKTRSGQFGF